VAIDRQQLGIAGEALVADWLQQQHWQILAQRWTCRWGELDLVAFQPQQQQLAFVEVKSRRAHSLDQTGMLAITPQKRLRLQRSALTWLARQPDYQGFALRFDVALVDYRSSPSENGLIVRAVAGGWLNLQTYLEHAFDGAE
jgi:putative endonuclease